MSAEEQEYSFDDWADDTFSWHDQKFELSGESLGHQGTWAGVQIKTAIHTTFGSIEVVVWLHPPEARELVNKLERLTQIAEGKGDPQEQP